MWCRVLRGGEEASGDGPPGMTVSLDKVFVEQFGGTDAEARLCSLEKNLLNMSCLGEGGIKVVG
jgi:hypothetical protein